MNQKEREIVYERFLKWAMFAVLVFCTGGLFFGVYCVYHLLQGSVEVRRTYLSKNEFWCFNPEVKRKNNPENLTEEEKIKLSKNPDVYLIFNIKEDGRSGTMSERDRCHYRGKDHLFLRPNEHYNPRYSYPYDESQWWNKDYQYKYEENEKKLELANKRVEELFKREEGK